MDNRDAYLSRGVSAAVPGSGPALAPPPLPPTPPAAQTDLPGLPDGSSQHGVRRRIGGALAAVAALIAKFWAAIKGVLLLLPKAKVLTTAGTALASVVLYALFWGWTFAVGFVALIFVHEMGHVIQLRREGVKASAPMFIPGFGAVVMMRALPNDALAEARVGLAGPVLGTVGAAACLAAGEAAGSDMLRALAYVGFLLNLINLVPVVPFDGGRAMAAMAPAVWFLGLGAILALLLITHNVFLLVFLLLGGVETWNRWKARKTRSLEQAAYYRVSPRNRMLVGAVYIGLIVLLVLGMHESQVLTTAGHSFRVA